MTDAQFCEIVRQLSGVPILEPDHLVNVTMDGPLLKEYIEKAVELLNQTKEKNGKRKQS